MRQKIFGNCDFFSKIDYIIGMNKKNSSNDIIGTTKNEVEGTCGSNISGKLAYESPTVSELGKISELIQVTGAGTNVDGEVFNS